MSLLSAFFPKKPTPAPIPMEARTPPAETGAGFAEAAAETTPPPRDSFERTTGGGGATRTAPMVGPTLSDADRAKLRDIAAHPERAGVTQAEADKLRARLENPSDKDAKLLGEVARSPNADRGAWTYARTKDAQEAHPDRIKDSTVDALTRGVSTPRAGNKQDQKGLMGQDQAERATKALVNMPEEQYQRIQTSLDKAGTSPSGNPIAGADANAERALTLKAVGARESTYDPKKSSRPEQFAAATEGETNNVTKYAESIRGMKKDTLIRGSTAMDTTANGRDDALKQRYTMSCVQTSEQIMRAEADPIYAKQLNAEKLSSTSSSGAIATEQRVNLEHDKGVAVPISGDGGRGTQMPEAKRGFDQEVGSLTGKEYRPNGSADPNNAPALGSTTAVRQSLDSIDASLARGNDVPMRVTFPRSGVPESQWPGHQVTINDVRGTGSKKEYQITDPATGSTSWKSADDLEFGIATLKGQPFSVTHLYVPTAR